MNRRAVLYFVLFVFVISVATGVVYRDRFSILYDITGNGQGYLETLHPLYLSVANPEKAYFVAASALVLDLLGFLICVVLAAVGAYRLANNRMTLVDSLFLCANMVVTVGLVLIVRIGSHGVFDFLVGGDSAYVFLARPVVWLFIVSAYVWILWRRARNTT